MTQFATLINAFVPISEDAAGRPDGWSLPPAGGEWDFVGAPLLAAELVAAAALAVPDQEIRSLHASFVRAASAREELAASTRRLHGGRRMSATAVTLEQRERVCCTGIVLSGPRVEDLVRHHTPAPAVDAPESCPEAADHAAFGEVRLARGDLHAERAQAPVHDVWARSPGLPQVPGLGEAVVAHRANQFIAGTALLQHEGMSMAAAHDALSAVITAGEVVFHEPVDPTQWLLFHQESTFAGGGWVFGRGQVFDEAGVLMASYSEQAMLRVAPAGNGTM